MSLHSCPTCGNQHDSGLPGGAQVFWAGRFPLVLEKEDRLLIAQTILEDGRSFQDLIVRKPNAEDLIVQHIQL